MLILSQFQTRLLPEFSIKLILITIIGGCVTPLPRSLYGPDCKPPNITRRAYIRS